MALEDIDDAPALASANMGIVTGGHDIAGEEHDVKSTRRS